MHDWNEECPPPWGEEQEAAREREIVLVGLEQARLMRYRIHFAPREEKPRERTPR